MLHIDSLIAPNFLRDKIFMEINCMDQGFGGVGPTRFYASTLQKQIGCFNHWVVTLVAAKKSDSGHVVYWLLIT